MSEELSVLAGETEVLTKFSFPPIIGANARLLILGTLPGEESLRLRQYYGHPRNHFWPLIAAIFDKSLPAAYAERERLLKRNRSALWDVLESAERVGSLNSAIRNRQQTRLQNSSPTIRISGQSPSTARRRARFFESMS